MSECLIPPDQLPNEIAEHVRTIRVEILKASEAWFKKSSDDIPKNVSTVLETYRNRLIFELLGFKTCGNNFELDHCNGRSGNSEAGDQFRSLYKQAIDKWFAENFKMPELTPKQHNEIYSAYASELMTRLKDTAKTRAKTEVDRILTQSIEGAMDRAKLLKEQDTLDQQVQNIRQMEIDDAVVKTRRETILEMEKVFKARMAADEQARLDAAIPVYDPSTRMLQPEL